jgi:histo-blood group ABO system transferase
VGKKILLHLIATGKYDVYLDRLMESAKKYFLPQEDLKFIVYTDSLPILESPGPDIIPIKIEHRPWPEPTLKRFHYFWDSRDVIEKSDFSFYVDVDSLFVKEITWESLGISDNSKGMIGTTHPGFAGGRGTPEYRSASSAYVPPNANLTYLCGGFFGGSSDHFLKAVFQMKRNIDSDLSKGVVAIWHDESHLNKYFLENPPISILDKKFTCSERSCPPDGGREINQYIDSNGIPYFIQPYLVFLEKNESLKSEKLNY